MPLVVNECVSERKAIDFLNPVDVHVGARIRATRSFRKFEIWELASAIQIPASLLME